MKMEPTGLEEESIGLRASLAEPSPAPQPFIDLTFQTQAVLEPFLERIRRLAAVNQFVGGRAVEEFEEAFALYCGTRFCVTLNSGTDALRLALLAAGVSPEDEVITTPFTFIATVEAIGQTGRLVLADIDPDTFTLSPDAVADKVTEQTRAIVPVHVFGQPAPMPELIELSKRHGMAVVEDACQAHGASISKQRAGSFGEAGAFSFYPSKNLGAFGDGGAVTTNDSRLAARVRRLRNHGQVGHYQHVEEGCNSRLDAIQAVLLSLKLGYIEEWNRRRRRLAAVYREQLAGLPAVRFQAQKAGFDHAYYLLAGRVERRAGLARYLRRLGIETKVIYPTPIHLLGACAHLGYRRGDFPNAEDVCSQVLCFPLYPGMTEDQAAAVAGAVRQFYVG